MKAVIYARYSSDNQREESIEGQLRECKAFADKNDMIILDTDIDRALSAKTDNRPEFQRMIKDSAKNLFDVVIVWKLDRFARNRYDSARYKAALKKNGVKVISAMETISDGPEGIILESMLEGYAEYYSAELSQKVSRGMTENVLNCKFNGGALTFGYIIDNDRHFQPDAETSPIVKDIFERYANGENTKSILNSLLIQGFKNKGKKPTYSFITNMLKNRRYLGEYRFKDTIVENAFEPLVAKEVFDKCQSRLAANKRNSAHFKKVNDTYLLTGKIFCGHCGGSMSGVSGTSKTGDVHRYYHCRNAKIKKSCKRKRISKDFIENLVFDATMQMLNDTSLINQIVDTCYEMQNKENSNIPIMKNQLKRVEKELENIMNAIKQGIITSSTKNALMELEQEKGELETKIAQEEIKKPVLSKEQIRCWLHHFRSYKRSNETQMQKLLDVFVNTIYVYDDRLLIT